MWLSLAMASVTSEIVAVHTHTCSGQLSLTHAVLWSQERQELRKFQGLYVPQSVSRVVNRNAYGLFGSRAKKPIMDKSTVSTEERIREFS